MAEAVERGEPMEERRAERSPADHLRAFLELKGLASGRWTVTLDVEDGIVRRAVATPRQPKVAFSWDELQDAEGG